MVILDSNHTEDHVLKELNLYSKIVSKKIFNSSRYGYNSYARKNE